MGLDASFSRSGGYGETLSGNITLHVPTDVSGTAMIKSFSGVEAQLRPAAVRRDHDQFENANSKKREFVFGDGKGGQSGAGRPSVAMCASTG